MIKAIFSGPVRVQFPGAASPGSKVYNRHAIQSCCSVSLKPSSREQVNSQIYADILAKIVSGEYPPGMRLIEEELGQKYKVSRTPIREVLFSLEKDGLVERVRHCGARVVAFAPDDVEEIYDIRRELECLAVRSAIRRIRLTDLLELERGFQALDESPEPVDHRRHAELDLCLHRLIIRNAGNKRLEAQIENLTMLIQSFRLLGFQNDEHTRRASREHLAIVRALIERDAAQAARVMAEHIDASKRDAVELFVQRMREGEPAGAFPITPISTGTRFRRRRVDG
jgi:DNA-binding GntR family transcriptional regulator